MNSSISMSNKKNLGVSLILFVVSLSGLISFYKTGCVNYPQKMFHCGQTALIGPIVVFVASVYIFFKSLQRSDED